MREAGFMLVPDLKSRDDRGGYELFEPLFNYLVLAAIFTALLSLSMHLQNVFLRAPGESNILTMVFGGGIEGINQAIETKSLDPVLKFLKSMNSVLVPGDEGISLQSYGAGVAFALLTGLVFCSVWFWLRKTALEGIATLRARSDLTDAEAERLDEIVVWPLGWISINVLLAIGFLIFLSMWFVNFLALVLVFFVIRSVSAIIGQIWESVRRPKAKRRRRPPPDNG
jgi:Na+-transporting methylmalonyl-CoA/oxaloacetate decarboxylase gamma subunit